MAICLKDKLALQEKQCFWWLTQISVFFWLVKTTGHFQRPEENHRKCYYFLWLKKKNAKNSLIFGGTYGLTKIKEFLPVFCGSPKMFEIKPAGSARLFSRLVSLLIPLL
jgi:hypothetical protein